MGMHLLVDKDSGAAIWINNSIENSGASCEFPTEIIAKSYLGWAFNKYLEKAKWGSIDEQINMRNEFISLISTCKNCQKDLEDDDIDFVFIHKGKIKNSEWDDFAMKCLACLEKEENNE